MCSLMFYLLIFLQLYVNKCSACNGYELKQFSIVNCDADNMITIEKNFTAKLTSDCEMSYDGCVKIKSFKEGMVKYRFSRDGYVLLTNSANLCNETIMGIHLSCPAGEIMFCLDDSNVFDMSVLKKTMSFLIGTSTLHAEITHDTGKSCIEFTIEISK